MLLEKEFRLIDKRMFPSESSYSQSLKHFYGAATIDFFNCEAIFIRPFTLGFLYSFIDIYHHARGLIGNIAEGCITRSIFAHVMICDYSTRIIS
uniref:Ovule protein n=1 Tax=Ascaris lumbricoides TaxID=6252 RepID=A0A0M3HTV0_ASCLU